MPPGSESISVVSPVHFTQKKGKKTR